MRKNVNLRRIAIEKDIKNSIQLTKSLSEPEIMEKIISLIEEGGSQKKSEFFDPAGIVALAILPAPERTKELREMKRKFFIERFLQNNKTLLGYKEELLRQPLGKDGFVGMIELFFYRKRHPDLEAIVKSAKNIKERFLRDCKITQKKYSSALNKASLQGKTTLLIAALLDPVCRWGSKEAITLIQSLIKCLAGNNPGGKTPSHLRQEVKNKQKQKLAID